MIKDLEYKKVRIIEVEKNNGIVKLYGCLSDPRLSLQYVDSFYNTLITVTSNLGTFEVSKFRELILDMIEYNRILGNFKNSFDYNETFNSFELEQQIEMFQLYFNKQKRLS